MSTTKATNWPEKEPIKIKVIKKFLFFIPKANPGYEKKMHLVDKWLIEFIKEEGEFVPWREVALDKNGNPIFAGPDKQNYGFWCDTNMTYEDFQDTPIEKEEFERYWSMTGVEAIKTQ